MTEGNKNNRMKEFRELAGFNRSEMARRTGLSITTIAKLEEGENKWPTLKNAREIAAVLKISGALKGEKGHPVDIVFPW
jgi:transcriptional regulator with XRE-family HTH domain